MQLHVLACTPYGNVYLGFSQQHLSAQWRLQLPLKRQCTSTCLSERLFEPCEVKVHLLGAKIK